MPAPGIEIEKSASRQTGGFRKVPPLPLQLRLPLAGVLVPLNTSAADERLICNASVLCRTVPVSSSGELPIEVPPESHSGRNPAVPEPVTPPEPEPFDAAVISPNEFTVRLVAV